MNTSQFMVESLERTVKREMEQRQLLSQETRKRLVWFVAIAGYVLLNGPNFGQTIAGRVLTGMEILPLVLPWLISSAFALLAHYLSDQSDMKANKFYTNKLAMIDLHLADLADGQPNVEEFNSIMYDKAPEIKDLREDADRSTRKVNLFETLSMLFIVLGFGWSVIFPLLLK